MDNEHLRSLARAAVGRHLRRFGSHGFTYDELYAEALYGIAQAIRTARAGLHPTQTSVHARLRAEGQIMDAWRNRSGSRRQNPVVLLPLHDEDDRPLVDDRLDELAAHQVVGQAMRAVLTPREREIVAEGARGIPVADTARRVGLSRSRVSQLRAAAARKVRSHLARPPEA